MKVDGPHLRKLRESRLALSIEDASKMAGVAPPTWLRAEHGGELRPGSVRRIAEALGIPPEELAPRPKAAAPFPEDWTQSFPGEGFPRAAKAATTDELLYAIKRNVGNLPAQSLEDFRQDRAAAMDAAMRRAHVLAHTVIVDQELRARPDVEPPAGFLPDYRAWLKFMDQE